MRTVIDNFTSQLHDNLEAVENRAKSLRRKIKSATNKDQTDIQLQLDAAKTSLAAKKKEFR